MDYYNNEYDKMVIFLLILKFFFIFLIYALIIKFDENIFNNFFFKKKYSLDYNKNNSIIDLKIYQNFENIKKQFYNDSFFRPFLNEVKIINYIYNKNYKLNNNYTYNVHVTFGFNNNYVYPILVLAKSILVTTNISRTFVSLHFLCTPDINQSSISIIRSLINKSPNVELIFYNMSNNFIKYKSDRYSQAAYYRLLVPIIIGENKIIYLDADTLVLKDITNMYELKLKDNYALGFLDYSKGYRREKRYHNYINDGVMLLNLKKIRNDKKIYDLLNMTVNGTKLPKDDQTIINYSFYPKIGRLPSIYGIWNFQNNYELKQFKKRLKQNIDLSELKQALKDPSLLHNVRCHPKIWYTNYKYRGKHNLEFRRFHNLWYKYAKKTDYFKEIKSIY